jgi:hypothetical protein
MPEQPEGRTDPKILMLELDGYAALSDERQDEIPRQSRDQHKQATRNYDPEDRACENE